MDVFYEDMKDQDCLCLICFGEDQIKFLDQFMQKPNKLKTVP